MKTLLKNIKLTRIANSAVAGVTAINSSRLDMSGFDGVLFFAALGDVLVNSVLTLTAEQNTIDSDTGMAAIGGTAAHTASATDADNVLLVLDVAQPRERFVRAVLTRTAANAVVDGIFAVQYRAADKPTTQGATVLKQAILTAPAQV